MSVEAVDPNEEPEEEEDEAEDLSPEEARRRVIGLIRSQPEILLCLIEEMLEELGLDVVEFMRRALGRWMQIG